MYLNRLHFLLAVASPLGVVHAAFPAYAQRQQTVTVIGEGEAAATPDYAVVKGAIKGGADTGEKAFEKYEEAKKKLETAFGEGAAVRVSLQFQGEKVAKASPADGVVAFPGGDAPAVAGEIVVSEDVVLRFEFENDMERIGIGKKLAQVVDRAKKAGVEFGQQLNIITMQMNTSSAIAKFELKNPAELRFSAYKKAMEDARRRAERLGLLAGGKIGRIIAVEEVGAAEKNDQSLPAIYAALYSAANNADGSEFSTEANQKVTYRQRLRVVFELEN